MIRIEIKSQDITTRSGVSSKTGKPYSIRSQEAYAYTFGRDGKPQPYPSRIELNIEGDGPGYNPGFYTLDPACVYVDRFGGLALARPRLIPSVSNAKQSA